MPQQVRGPHRQLWRHYHTGLISYCSLFKSNVTPTSSEPQVYMLSVAPEIESCVSNIMLQGQGPLLHTSAVVPLGKECQVLLETVLRICRKLFHGSTGQSSTDLLETVPGTYLKEFQIFIWKSSKYLLERVPGIYWKEFQVSTGKSSKYALERRLCGPQNSVGCGGNRTSVTLLVSVVKYQNWPQTFMSLACIITPCHVNM